MKCIQLGLVAVVAILCVPVRANFDIYCRNNVLSSGVGPLLLRVGLGPISGMGSWSLGYCKQIARNKVFCDATVNFAKKQLES